MSAPGDIAVLGGRGMLGTDLVALLRNRGMSATVYDLPEFDITRAEQIEASVQNKILVINCAAYTNVDRAESERELSYKVNAEAVRELGRIAACHNVPVLHISTDFVFDGNKDAPYDENDVPHPLGVYGDSKLKGEQYLIQSGCAYCIVRLQWTYGLGGNNFVTKLLARARSMERLRVVDDQIGSPTATVDVARALFTFIQKRAGGLFHFASTGYVSRYGMARFILEHKGIDIPLEPCKTTEFPSPAQRPLNSRFDCRKARGYLGEPIPVWQEGLRYYLEQL